MTTPHDLSLTGSEIDSALTKVHAPDSSAVNGSLNMVTSSGVYNATHNLDASNLDTSFLKTDLSSGTNNTTIPTTQAVKNLLNAGVNLPWMSLRVTASSASSNYADITGWTVYQGNSGITVSGADISVPSGIWIVACTSETTDNTPGVQLLKNAVVYARLNFEKPSGQANSFTRPSTNIEIKSGGTYKAKIAGLAVRNQTSSTVISYNFVKIAE